MKKILIIAGIIAVMLGVGAITVVSNYGIRKNDVLERLTPAIIYKSDTRVFEIEATGDPNKNAAAAFSMLMYAYFRIKDTPRGANLEVPRARWPKPQDTPKDEWVGIYAIPIPHSVTSIPKVKSKNGLTLKIDKWTYGNVAEVLHVGPYSSEDTSIAKLQAFITEKGYEICGPQEEEYLKSFGLFPVAPKNFLTIIRYQVCRKEGKAP